LIFDEVSPGFRVGDDGAHGLVQVRPDRTGLGKIIGGGFPVGAFGGREEIMNALAPVGPVYQAGTLSGNPLAMTAGLTTLRILKRDKDTIYRKLEQTTASLVRGLADAARDCNVEVRINHIGSMFTVFFASGEVTDWASASQSDRARFSRFFQALLDRGVYFPPSQFETAFVSAAHDDEVIARTIEAARQAFRALV